MEATITNEDILESIKENYIILNNSRAILEYDKKGVHIITTINEESKWAYCIKIKLKSVWLTFYHDESHCYDYAFDDRSTAEENALILAKSLCETYNL